MKKYLAFDLEISTPIPAGTQDWKQYRPFGVSCVVTKGSDHEYPLIWTSQHFGDFASRMFEQNLAELLGYLTTMQRKGYTLLSFNGLGFDLDVLNEEHPDSGWAELAVDHVDLFFQIFCIKGYCKGLDAIAKGYGMGKPEGVSGALAPQMWLDGRYHEVLDYCAGDIEMTLNLAHTIVTNKSIQWLAKNGTQDITAFPDGLLTVTECLKIPEPSNPWMKDPWKRERFTGWMKQPDTN